MSREGGMMVGDGTRVGRRGLAVLGSLAILAALEARPAWTASRTTEDWRTPAEHSDYRTTPRYDETLAYLRRLAVAAPCRVRIETFGKTGEGRDLHIVVASGDGVFDPAALRRAGRPIVLIQNAIHAGEMDGKDACLALLRDMAVTGEKAALLERPVVVIIPIYNADGHERFGPHHRINQNGPEQTGWRTQARNLNLNRDYLKADAPETRAFLALWNRWLPDLLVDNHVTDGADYVYDTTYFVDSGPDVYPALARWNREVLAPYLEESVGKSGHAISPYFAFKDETDPAKGTVIGQSQPRFSTGFAVLQNRPGLLLEMHMLKDYKTRVSGNYEFMRALLEVVNRDAGLLVRMNRDADAATVAAGKRHDSEARFPLRLEPDGATEPVTLRMYGYTRRPSAISGGMAIDYRRDPVDMVIPRQTSLRVSRAVAPPLAYIVPAQWPRVIDVLAAHGLRIQKTSADWTGEVETYRCEDVRWQERPFEGRQILVLPASAPPRPAEQRAGEPRPGALQPGCTAVRERLSFPAGSAVVPLDQRAAKIAIHFLEPEGPDSAVAWGFFNAIFEQKEYAEAYVIEKYARERLAADPDLKAEFERLLAADQGFAASPEARLGFFYRRSPWWDARLGLYPVGRLASLAGVPIER